MHIHEQCSSPLLGVFVSLYSMMFVRELESELGLRGGCTGEKLNAFAVFCDGRGIQRA